MLNKTFKKILALYRYIKYIDYYIEVLVKKNSGRCEGDPSKNGEFKVLEKIVANKKKFVFFDGGSNVGEHIIYFDKLCKLNGIFNSRIIAVEPFPVTVKSLKSVIKINKIVNIKIHQVALGSKEKKINFYSISKNISSGANSCIPHYYLTDKSKLKIKQTTIDNIMLKNNIKYIDFLKLDIEGMELKALIGASEALSKNLISYIQLEYNQTWIEGGGSIKKVMELCNKYSYSLYRINKNSLLSIPKYDFNIEDFCYSNLLLVKKGLPLPLRSSKKVIPIL